MNIKKTAKWAWIAAVWALGACGQPELSCKSADDCAQGQLCRLDQCVTMRDGMITDHEAASDLGPAPHWFISQGDMSEEDGSSPSSAQEDMSWGMPLTPQAGCQGESPKPGQLVIHEVLMSVPAELQGDANADGRRDAYEDEFVEVLNVSEVTLSLHGVQLISGERARYTFAQDCLEPGQAAVVFGGPKTAKAHNTDGVLWRYAPARLSLSNTKGRVALSDAQRRELFIFEYEAPQALSYTLSPQYTGTRFVPHTELSGALFSPGRCASGQPLLSGCPLDPAGEGDALDMGHPLDVD